MANAKAHRRLRSTEEVELSRFKADTYKQNLLLALNWYNKNVSDATLRKWTLEYAKESRPDAYETLKGSSLPDYAFHHPGILAHLTSLEFEFNEVDALKLDRYIDEVVEAASVKIGSKQVTRTISLDDRLKAAAETRCAEVDAMVDAFVIENKPIDLRSFLITNNVGGLIMARLRAHFKGFLDDLRELAKTDRDPLLVEGYSNLSVRVRRHLIEQLNLLFDTRIKTSKRKPKPPAKVVKNLVFLKKHEELGLISIDPVKLVGAHEVWFYNVKMRVVTVLKGQLEVCDRVIKGYDLETSTRKRVRNPRKYFHRLGRSAATLADRFSRSKTKEQPITSGRLGKSVIILAAF